MPRVTFVVEHRQIEVEAGRRISDVAAELGIECCREELAGSRFGNWTVWVQGDNGCLSPPDWYERWVMRVKGWRRAANRARILGDCKIWTQQGIGTRLRAPRPLDAAARPTEDPRAERFDHAHNAAGTAWNPYGHPKAVGRGARDAPRYEPKKGKKEEADAEAESE
jgi:hypothetical protein